MTDNIPDGIVEMLEEAIAKSTWNTAPVEDEPEVSLVRWQVFEIDGKRRFLGYNERNYEGRVSSTIITFDEKSKKGITKSGRVYQLIGDAGWDPDADWVLGRWLPINGFVYKDIQWRVV